MISLGGKLAPIVSKGTAKVLALRKTVIVAFTTKVKASVKFKAKPKVQTKAKNNSQPKIKTDPKDPTLASELLKTNWEKTETKMAELKISSIETRVKTSESLLISIESNT